MIGPNISQHNNVPTITLPPLAFKKIIMHAYTAIHLIQMDSSSDVPIEDNFSNLHWLAWLI